MRVFDISCDFELDKTGSAGRRPPFKGLGKVFMHVLGIGSPVRMKGGAGQKYLDLEDAEILEVDTKILFLLSDRLFA